MGSLEAEMIVRHDVNCCALYACVIKDRVARLLMWRCRQEVVHLEGGKTELKAEATLWILQIRLNSKIEQWARVSCFRVAGLRLRLR
jgi:hypothetical protein